MTRPGPTFCCALSALALVACSARDTGSDAGLDAWSDAGDAALADGVATDGLVSVPAHCNPLGAHPDHCLLPWPSSFYLRQDSDTATGFRVAYPMEAMPSNDKGQPVDPARWNLLDGFSPGSQPIVALPGGFSSAGLPPVDDLAASVSDHSLVWILELDTGVRVPLFAELDANDPPDRAALIIRPQRPLRHDARHVVVLRAGLRNAAGAPVPPPEAFRRLRDREPVGDDERLRAEGQRLQPVFAFLAQQVALEQVVLAWDFHTASREAVTGPLVGMVDEALSRLPVDGPAFEITDVVTPTPAEASQLLLAASGQLSVPSFLQSDDPDAWLELDERGRPRHRGEQPFAFWLSIPRCAEQAPGPIPVLVVGHGLFGDPAEMLRSALHRDLSQRLCMAMVATRWIGLSSDDVTAAGVQVATDLSNLPRVTDRLQQAQVNAHVLVELVRSGKLFSNPALAVNGQPVAVDSQQLYYLGISLGAIQGVTLAALNQRIERYVLNVGAGWWSMMMERSSNFTPLAVLLGAVYRRATDRLLLFAMTQSLWDATDPIGFADLIRTAPLPGYQPRHICLQEARHDDQVPNIATRAVVRALGLPLLTPAVEAVFGVDQAPGPLESAYVQWDVNPPAIPPAENLPAERLDESESAHYIVRRLESFRVQVERFLRPGGLVEHSCDGPCGRE